MGKLQVHAEIKKFQLFNDIDVGKKAIRVALNHEVLEGNKQPDGDVEAQNDDPNNNEDSSGADSHRLFPEEGKPKYDSPPRHLP